MRLIDADALLAKFNKKTDVWTALTDESTSNDFAFYCNLADAVDEMPTICGWISVKDRLPDSNHVLARCEIRGLYKPKSYTCVAFYAKKNSISVGNCFDDEISCEYDEETDEYYLKEGWYEVIRNWDEYGSVVIGDFVTHWMPLPEAPEA